MSFKHISDFSPAAHFVQRSGLVCAILLEGTLWNISVKLY